jgi:hypothetical protein
MIPITRHVLTLILVLFLIWHAHAAEVDISATETGAAPEGILNQLRDGFSARFTTLGFGIVQQPVNSPVNPGNINNIFRYSTELDLRPDFNLTFKQLELGLKPRLNLVWQKWDSGPKKGSEKDTDLYVQEGFARYRIIDPLIVSYGRENLQWGPSYLVSPSNPFNFENGKNNPVAEVPALDYGRMLWLPTDHWTLSFIANTSKGRQTLIRDFETGYAVKVDYSAGGKYLSLIPSYREDGRFRFGYYGGWTVSDAFLLHSEGSFPESKILFGGAYTLDLGPTIVAEYFRNEAGCSRQPFNLCFSRFGKIEEPTLALFRRNYFLLQYNHTRIRDTADVIIRWIHDLDDDSNRIVNIVQYDVGTRAQLFAIANVFPAPKKTEFGSFLDYSVMFGARFTF